MEDKDKNQGIKNTLVKAAKEGHDLRNVGCMLEQTRGERFDHRQCARNRFA